MPETTLLAVAGLALDRAWPELGPVRGAQRRDESRAALVQLADAARRGVDALVVAGDLLDRRSVEPATLDLLVRLFEAIAVPVVIAPGTLDWYSDDSPLATTDWPANVHVVTDPSGEPIELSTGLVIWASAVTSPLLVRLSIPGPGVASASGQVAVVHGTEPVQDADLDAAGVAHAVVAVPDVTASTRRATSTGAAVPTQLGASWPSCAVSLILDAEGRLLGRDVLPLPVTALTVVEVDAEACLTSEQLRGAVQKAADAGAGAVRLTGRLASGVLLPHLLPDSPPDIEVDATAVDHELSRPPDDDFTTAAAFLRDLTAREGPPADRHQAAALGLLALDSARGDLPPVEGS